ncbi:hypothetical protein PG994_006981 [Apiospora phragmitis]|uniref:Cytochrome P450 monooxygenase n=1 Tax=Apiospora phragmitis TaxID=2905665 RepID=A0ABR1UZK7_9PEZI
MMSWPSALVLSCLLPAVARLVYNIWLHPLADVPGPFWARASGIPSWLHAMSGKRHIWLWQQFQIFGPRIRITPNTVLFCDSTAYADVYGMKSNVRRSHFYTAFKRKISENTTLNTIDVAQHAYKRKLLQTCFTEKSMRAATTFIIKHVDRWNEVLTQESGTNEKEWSAFVNFSDKIDALIFDIMGDLSFGRSFDIKEPGENQLKVIPHTIVEYMKFYYPFCRSPFLPLLIWLKPRGIDWFFDKVTPPSVQQQYNKFIFDSVTNRIKLHREQKDKPEREQRQVIFHFLCEARDPDTGLVAYDETDLRTESSLLIIAGTDTTSVSISGIFFYLKGDPGRLQKLTDEIRTTFDSAEEIVLGPKLRGCQYFLACIDEGMRLTPSGPCELPREVLSGGMPVKGRYYPRGHDCRDGALGQLAQRGGLGRCRGVPTGTLDLGRGEGRDGRVPSRIKANFHPFSTGPGSCVGRPIAMAEIMIVVARTLYRFDLRRAPGSTTGGGRADLGWGARDEHQM